MKIRNGFVSNSSSSSFIVIGKGAIPNTRLERHFTVGERGCYEFGWQNEMYNSLHDRLNFAFIQAREREYWRIMLQNVLERHGVVHTHVDLDDGYIDHQSAACEGENIEMFESLEALERFIFCEDSYIQGGNDNED